jgi:polyvinyl alcohol dehydrogenase (cytochrome)
MFTNIQQAGTRDAEAHGRGSSAGRSEFRDMTVVAVVVTGLWHGMAATPSAQPSGEAIYRERCAACHDLVTARIPPRDALRNMSSARILRALDFGVMMNVAYPLRRDEREAVATFLGKAGGDPAPPPSAFCAERTAKLAARPKIRWNGWSPTDGNVRFQPADQAMLTVEQVSRLELKWAFAFDGDIAAFAQPTILDRALFVGSAGGLVHSIDVDSGCLHWVFQANGPVRSALLAVALGNRHALMFSDLVGWVYAVDAETGKLLWKKRVEEHETTRLTGAAAVYNGTVFIPVASWEESRAIGPNYPCCTFRGSVVALKIADGSQLWKTYTIAEEALPRGKNRAGTEQRGPSGAGVWGSPTVDAKRGWLYVTTGDNFSTPPTNTSDAVMALDIKTGRTIWSRQVTSGDAYNSACGDGGANCPPENGPDFDFGSSALLIKGPGGRDFVVAGQKSGVVTAFDPDRQGQILWQTRVGKGGVNGGVQWGMASDGKLVYAAVSDVVRIRNTNADPTDPARFSLNPQEGGGLTALRVETGEKVWYATPPACSSKPGCSPAQSAAITAIPGLVFSGSLDGHLRAFSAVDGKIVWDVDTAREYDAVNGVKGRGGSLDGPGAVVVGGMLFVNSGYSRFGGMPGNVLLAFAPRR